MPHISNVLLVQVTKAAAVSEAKKQEQLKQLVYFTDQFDVLWLRPVDYDEIERVFLQLSPNKQTDNKANLSRRS
jgi:hypothetical protein